MASEKGKYLSIGELSKISGVNIKSLRYYERIGVLIPAYVNQDTGYRYYTFSQFGIVEAIQFCVELGIPLKEFNDYIDENQNILYSKLLKHASEVAAAKIRAIQDGLEFVGKLKETIERTKAHSGRQNRYSREIQSMLIYRYPIENPDTIADIPYIEVSNAIQELFRQGIQPAYEYGLLYEYEKNGKVKRNIYIEIANPPDIGNPNIIELPTGEYYCRQAQDSQIEQAQEHFAELFKKGNVRYVIETYPLSEKHQIDQDWSEIRTLMQ